jgi:hypothetical protein
MAIFAFSKDEHSAKVAFSANPGRSGEACQWSLTRVNLRCEPLERCMYSRSLPKYQHLQCMGIITIK